MIALVHVLGRFAKPVFVSNSEYYIRRTASSVALNVKDAQDDISDKWL